MCTPIVRTPALGIMKFTILGYNYFILSLSDLCLGVEEKIFKEIMHFHCMTYGHTLAQEPLPWGS